MNLRLVENVLTARDEKLCRRKAEPNKTVTPSLHYARLKKEPGEHSEECAHRLVRTYHSDFSISGRARGTISLAFTFRLERSLSLIYTYDTHYTSKRLRLYPITFRGKFLQGLPYGEMYGPAR